MARPTKLTKEIIDDISDAIYQGVSILVAARYAGITPQTFYIWKEKAKKALEKTSRKTKNEKLLIYFLTEVDKSEAQAIVKWQQVVDKSALKDPVWAWKMLTHRDQSYREIPITGNFDLTNATNEQLRRIAAGENPLIVLSDTGASAPTPPAETGPDERSE